jgi:hypothetical protein
MALNKFKFKRLSLLVAVILFSLSMLSCQSTITTAPRLRDNNMDIINYQDFFLDTVSTGLNTSVRGTIFAKYNENDKSKLHVQIVSWVEIDRNDPRGVSFDIPRGWYVSAINTSFPEGNPKPENYTSVWYKEYFNQYPEKGEPIWVQIGGTDVSHIGDAYGQGNVIIEIDPISANQDQPENINIDINAGPQSPFQPFNQKEITVPLKVDYRTTSP